MLALLLALAPAAVAGFAQAIPETTADTEAALHAMSRLAGVIFAGQVLTVRRQQGRHGATGVIEIEFAVEDAVRGVSGGTYTLREWAGLWPAGDEPFRAGQRFLMLLHAPGASGLSSPVGGRDGAIPIRGSAPLPQTGIASSRAQAAAASVSSDSGQSDVAAVDLSWIATRVARPISYRVVERPTGRPTSAHPFAVPTSFALPDELAIEPETLSVAADTSSASATRAPSYTAVLATLRRWEKDGHAAR
jgi:hypothetical protein